MGSQTSTPLAARSSLVKKLASETNFTPTEIHGLYASFRAMAISDDDDNQISSEEFSRALSRATPRLSQAIFRAIDTDQSGFITFPEFVRAMSAFSAGSNLDDKILMSFRVYDADGTGNLTLDELASLFVETASAAQPLSKEVEQRLLLALRAAFEVLDSNSDGIVTLGEYARAVRAAPELASYLTIDFKSILGI